MDALKSCLKPATLRQALRTLPRTLDETYERILKSIKETHIEDVLKMLRWLIYAKRPLTLGELAKAVAISVDDIPIFDPENRLRRPVDSLRLCSTLVHPTRWNQYGEREHNPVDCVVRLAHYSVQEYLLCNSNVSDLRTSISFEKSTAQKYIAKACLTYLLYMGKVLAGNQHFSRQNAVKTYLLCYYAAFYWHKHAIKPDGSARLLMHDLFFSETALIFWTCLYNPAILAINTEVENDMIHLDQYYYRNIPTSSHHCKAIYVASYLGFTGLVEELVDRVENLNLEVGMSGTALGAAAYQGHTDVLRFLLERGAQAQT